MRRSRIPFISLTLIAAISLAAALGNPGDEEDRKRKRERKPERQSLEKNTLNFNGLKTIQGFQAEMNRERGFYAESREDAPNLDLTDAMEATAYTQPSVLESIREMTEEFTPPRYARACEPGERIVLGAVGDVLLHQPLAVQGMSRSDGFRSLWSDLESYMAAPDFMYANLEGPTAGAVSTAGRFVADPGRRFDRVAYSSYPMFNYHPALVGDLKTSGTDVLSTANNHALDRRSLGVDRTIENLLANEMPFTGTRTSVESGKMKPAESNWSTVTEFRGFKIGWVACTFSTNGIPDSKSQVLKCFEQRSIVLDQIRSLRADPSIDAVIATPHWGVEYTHTPGADQRKLARDMIEAGALIVFGSHPHVLQPVDKIVASDGREGYVIYSLGNFVSGQKGVAKRTSALVYVGLTKNAAGEVFINGARHLPIAMMYGSDGLKAKPAKGHFPEGRLLANRVLSRSQELEPGEALVTNPGCP